MKSEKGFTLVELIAVVVVLAIIALIAVPAVSNYLYDAESEYYKVTESSILASARDYFSDYHTLLPKNDGDVRELPIQELVDDGYIEEIKNNEDQKCDGTVYAKRLGNRDYTYCIVLKCADKVKKNTCTNGEADAGDKEFEILRHEAITIPQCSNYAQMLEQVSNADFKYQNKLIGLLVKKNTTERIQNNGQDILVYPDESTLSLNALGTYKLNYEYSGAASKITTVTVVDGSAPNPGSIHMTFYKGDIGGAEYKCKNDSNCTWTNQDVIVKFEGTDIENLNGCGQAGSGIVRFYYTLNDGLGEQQVSAFRTGNGKYTGYVRINKTYKGPISVRAVDGTNKTTAGNTNDDYQYLKIDKVAPTCVSSDGSTWVNHSITIKGTCTDDAGGSGCTEATKVITKSFTTNTNLTNQSPGKVKDVAGNETECPANQTVQVDLTTPATGDITITDRTNSSNPVVKATCTDDFGELVSTNASISCVKNGTSSTCTATCKDKANNSSSKDKTYTWSAQLDPCGTYNDNYHDCMNCYRSYCSSYTCRGDCLTAVCPAGSDSTYPHSNGVCFADGYCLYSGTCRCMSSDFTVTESRVYTNCVEYCENEIGKGSFTGGALTCQTYGCPSGFSHYYGPTSDQCYIMPVCGEYAYNACCPASDYNGPCGDNTCWDTHTSTCWH